ncbi:hypothetical protein [Azospirillum melinis]
MATSLITDRAQHAKELLGPYLAGALMGFVAYNYVVDGTGGATLNIALYDRLYSGVLSVAAAFSGFAFGYYTLIATKATPFLERISRNTAYRILLSQIKEATLWVVILVAMTGFYYVAQVIPKDGDIVSRGLFSLWAACLGIAIYSWVRVSKNTLDVMGL